MDADREGTGMKDRLLAAAAALWILLPSPPAAAGDAPEKEPSPKSAGKVCAWKSKGGLRYEYFVPGKYDPAKGANLTFILHGTGLDRRWGFANHAGGEFRPDDVVVSPDGPTPVNNRLWANEADDLQALHDLQEEMKKVFKVRQVFVYGHSQGAFFAFLYAATFPKEVAGALGQAGGIWTNTPLTSENKDLHMVLMHGTADPVVPFSNSRGGWDFLLERGYANAHLRALEGWNHWPNAFFAAQELAWLEGMTTADPERAVASLEHFEKIDEKEAIDFSGWYGVAKRVASMDGVPTDVKARAAADMNAVEDLAKGHATAIRLGAGKEPKLEAKPWIGQAIRFLRDFPGVPACDDLAKEWTKVLDLHKDKGVNALRQHYQVRQRDPKKAFEAGVRAVRDGFLYYECADPIFLKALDDWEKDAKKLKLDPAALKGYRQCVEPYVDALKKGLAEYLGLNRKV
jgi:predicted esterase